MNEDLLVIMSGVASFVGSYAALKVHVNYIRRDIDSAIIRINELSESIEYIERNFKRNNHV